MRQGRLAKILDERGVSSRDIWNARGVSARTAAQHLSDKPRAQEAYEFVVDMWQHGDPSLQWYVAEARAELRELNAEPDGTHIPVEAVAPAAP